MARQISLRFRPAVVEDLSALAELERISYPADEAATREVLFRRLSAAAQCTLVALRDQEPVGFVCGTRSECDSLTQASMNTHAPGGQSLCIHSVVVTPELRRQGIGLRLLSAYLEYAAKVPRVTQVLLITKEHLVAFYQEAGFQWRGPSAVVHGQDPWFEMCSPVGLTNIS